MYCTVLATTVSPLSPSIFWPHYFSLLLCTVYTTGLACPGVLGTPALINIDV
jgi:hypothetical protein